MKKCVFGIVFGLCAFQYADAATQLPFGRRPPAQSMLQAVSSDLGSQTEPAEAASSVNKSVDLSNPSSLVTVDGGGSRLAPKAAATPAPQKRISSISKAQPRWESVRYQGSQQDSTFVVTDPAPSMMMGQLSDLKQKHSSLSERLTHDEESQSDKISELTVQMMQLKNALIAINRAVQTMAKDQQKVQSDTASSALLGSFSLSTAFYSVLSALIVLLLGGCCLWWKQSRHGGTSQQAVSLRIAETYISVGDHQLAKQVLKQVLTQGNEKERAQAALLMAELP